MKFVRRIMRALSQRHIYFKRSLVLGICLSVALAATGQQATTAQQPSPRVWGWADQEVATPILSGAPLGQGDASALAELSAYQTATGLNTWVGMTATGQVVWNGSSDSLPATLSMLPHNRVRLDITEAAGVYSTVIKGAVGYVLNPDGTEQELSSRSAVVGLAPFDISSHATIVAPQQPISVGPTFAITDQGNLAIEGRSMHRISIEQSIPEDYVTVINSARRAVIDCYFDPQTHLLRKTSSRILWPSTGRQELQRVTTYRDYQTFNNLLLPMHISETINGQHTWTLTLTTIDTVNLPLADIF